MSSEPKWYAGQPIILKEHNGPPYQTTVSRVGRKYVYAKRWRQEIKFHADTGVQVSEYGDKDHIYTNEQWVELQARIELRQALRDAGIEFRGYGDPPFSNAVLQRLLDALQVEGDKE